MTPAPFRWAMRGNLAQIRHVDPVRPRAAAGVVARVYASAEREFGLLAPPLALHSPEPGVLAAAWLLLRETLLAAGTTSRAEREVVAAAVSLANRCPYCVAVHGAVLGGVHRGPRGRSDAEALAADRIDDVTDPRLRSVARWARSGGRDPAPFAAAEAPEMLGVLLAFHYLNRMVQVFLGPSPLPAALPDAASGAAGALLGRVLGPTARRAVTPGADLDLLPPAPAASGLDWAAGRPELAAALQRACGAVDEAGGRVLDPGTRSAVLTSVLVHGGQAPTLGLDWETPALSGVSAAQRPLARLALFTALVPHRVDDGLVAAFRERRPADADLVAVAAWGALAAARQATAGAARSVPGGDRRAGRLSA